MKVRKAILIISGVLCCLYGLAVNALISSVNWFNYAGFFVGGVLIAAGIFLRQLHALVRRLPKVLAAVLCAAALAVLIHFAVFEVRAVQAAHAGPDPSARYLILLGAKVNGTVPTIEYQRRIDAALAYAGAHEELVIICTGGQGKDEKIAEAAAAYDYLAAHGIGPERLLKEEKSTSTEENFLYAKELIAAREGVAAGRGNAAGAGTAEAGLPDIIVVTSAFHLYRAGLIAEKYGFANVSYLGSRGLAILEPHYYFREYAAYIKMLLF